MQKGIYSDFYWNSTLKVSIFLCNFIACLYETSLKLGYKVQKDKCVFEIILMYHSLVSSLKSYNFYSQCFLTLWKAEKILP